MTAGQRKGAMYDAKVGLRAIARSVPCSVGTVSRVVNGQHTFETPITRRVKAVIAEAVGLTVAELWPEASTVEAAA